MAIVTIRIALSAAGQKASLLAGGDGKPAQYLAVESGSPDFVAVLERSGVDGNGVACWHFAGCEDPRFDVVPTVAEVVTAAVAQAAAKAKAAAEKVEKIVASTRATVVERKTVARRGCAIVQATEGSGVVSADVGYDYLEAWWPYPVDETIKGSPESVAWIAELAAARQVTHDAALIEAQAKMDAKIVEKAVKDAAAAEVAAKRAAWRQVNGIVDGDRVLKIEDGALVTVPSGCWESHSRGKNWLATISVDASKPGGLDRDFAAKAKGDSYYLLPSLNPGDAIEFGADYYSGGGRKTPTRWYGFVVQILESTGINGDAGRWLIVRECASGKAAVKAGEKYAATTSVPQSPVDQAIVRVNQEGAIIQ